MFKGKRFQDNADQRIITVLEENDSWVTLDDSRNIKTSVFKQKFTEYLDENFFNNDSVMESLANQFSQQINLNTIPVVDQNGSTISFTNPNSNANSAVSPAGYYVDDKELTSDEKKRELLEKFQNNYVPPSRMDEAIDMNMIGRENVYQPAMQQRQRGSYTPPEESNTVIKDSNTGQILSEPIREQQERPQPQDDIYKIYQNNQDQYQTQTRPPEQRPIEQPRQEQLRQPTQQQQYEPNKGMVSHDYSGSAPGYPNYPTPVLSPEEEESFVFFRRFKKVHPITIDVSFNEKIAEPNYVRQTALNFEGDIIKFYTKELMKKIWADPSILEEQIYEKLRFIIMGKEEKSSLSDAIEETTKIITDEKHLENIKEKWEGDISFSEYCDPEPENPINYADYIADNIEKDGDIEEKPKFTIEDAKNVEKVIENILFETKVNILIPTDLTEEEKIETLIPTEVSKYISNFISNENNSTENEA
jgi:hypothetical protein